MPPATSMLPLGDALREVARLGVPLLHFGQTVFWDEPTKALLFPAMREAGVRIPVIAGVHDTDYFSKLPAHVHAPGPFAVLPANDGSTRDLWVGPCECSALFGSEHRIPLRLLSAAGVPVRRLAAADPSGREAFANAHTEAWGWRGVARIAQDPVTARDVPTRCAARAIRELVSWALSRSLELLSDERLRGLAERNASRLLCGLDRALEAHEGDSLSHCFRTLLRGQIERLAGGGPLDELRVTSSTEYYRFTRETAGLVRFRPLGLFLDPETASRACAAYDDAVRGTGAYALDSFGEGALPFDIVVPGRGRGTLHRTDEDVRVDLPAGAVTLGSARGVRTTADLAALVERRLGRECSLIAKAVVLPLMFLGDSVMVLAESGSRYVATATRRLVRRLRESGIEVAIHPVLRIRYQALEALGAVDGSLTLPEHLAASYGTRSISLREFAARWREVVAEAEETLGKLRASAGARTTLQALGEAGAARRQRYECLLRRMREHGAELASMSASLRGIARQAREAEVRAREWEVASGRIRRERLRPIWRRLEADPDDQVALAELREAETERGQAQERLREARTELRALSASWRELRERIVHEQRTGVSVVVHRELHRLEEEAAAERIHLVRRAALTTSLADSDRRPSAWWFLLLAEEDHSLPWYDALRAGAVAWIEDLTADEET